MTRPPVSWRSPGRVNLIGEHTDYNDGFCLPLAIGPGCTVRISAAADDTFTVHSRQQPRAVTVPSLERHNIPPDEAWAAYALGPAWVLQHRGLAIPPVRLDLDSDVPLGAGLSSSAALQCAVAAALADFVGAPLDRDTTVAVAREAENDYVGAPTGGMDQLASVFGQTGHALLCDLRTLAVQPVHLDLDAYGLSLLVVDSRAPHQLTDGAYADRRLACETAARSLGVAALRDVPLAGLAAALGSLDDEVLRRRVRHVVTENDRTLQCASLLQAGRVAEIGALLDASHVSLRDDFEVSVPAVDLIVASLRAAGALGARITGGGFGGCAIAVVPRALVPTAIDTVREASAAAGFTEPAAFEVEAAAGTHRL